MYQLDKYLIYYFILINILAFVLFFIDKKKAIKHKYRISENTLLLVCALGGAIGGLAGMKVFHHKTKKLKFQILPALFLAVQIYGIYKLDLWMGL